MINNKLNNIFKYLLYIIMFFTCFKLTYFSVTFPVIDNIYSLLQIVMLFIILIMYSRNSKISKIVFYIAIYLAILLISTILNNASISESIILIIKTLSMCLMFDYGIRKDNEIFFKIGEKILFLFIFLNLITIILYPSGMYISSAGPQNWLLGFKNVHILYILPALIFSFINSYYNYGKLGIKNYLLLIISLVTLILINSSTSLIGIILIIVFVLFQNIISRLKLLNIKNYFIIHILSFFMIIIFRIQNLFDYIIVDIFHKNLTFTGRTYIWDYVIEFIKQKPLIGYGFEESVVRLNKTTYFKSFHAHNQILEIIYKTGIIGMISFSIIVYSSFKQLYMNRKSKVSVFLSIVMFAYMIMMITEAYSYEYILYLFVICYNIKYFIKKQGEINE